MDLLELYLSKTCIIIYSDFKLQVYVAMPATYPFIQLYLNTFYFQWAMNNKVYAVKHKFHASRDISKLGKHVACIVCMRSCIFIQFGRRENYSLSETHSKCSYWNMFLLLSSFLVSCRQKLSDDDRCRSEKVSHSLVVSKVHQTNKDFVTRGVNGRANGRSLCI